ncbi:MAG: hypothetical protein M3Q48_08370 [Actinomycetota bacterium]|nr:hypothetical protein [Actinomycetota bacterium]
MNRFRRSLAVALVAMLPVAGGACSDDDQDGEAELEAPEVDVRSDDDTNTEPTEP